MEQGIRLIYGDPKVKAVYINYTASFKRTDQILTTLWNEFKLNPYMIQNKPTVIRLSGCTAQSLKESAFQGREEEMGVEFVDNWDKSVERVIDIAKEM
jgi:succinyl-CoA synthetase beta subunit